MTGLGRRAFLAAGATILAGCSAGVEAPDAASPSKAAARSPSASASTDRETPRGEPTVASSGDVERRWKTFVPGQYTLSAPALGADSLYIGGDRQLRRLAVSDGAVSWETPLGALSHAFVPALGDGVVYAGARDMVGETLLNSDDGGTVTALGAADGSVRWQIEAPVTGDPVLADGRVLVPTTGADGAGLLALGAGGDERWRAGFGAGNAFAAPTLAGDLALVPVAGEDAGRVLAVDLADGEPVWRRETARVSAPAEVADGIAYVGAADGTLHALDLVDGAERWQRSFDRGVYTRPAVDGGVVYVAVGDTIRALDAADGDEHWRATASNVSRTGLAVTDGRVYVGGNEVVALETAGGEAAWRQQLVGVAGTFGAPVVRDGVLYTGACVKREGNDPYDHYVYALAETPG